MKPDGLPQGHELTLHGLPKEPPSALFPVIRIECDGRPQTNQWGRERLWGGDPTRVAEWARGRGTAMWVDGKDRGAGRA